MNRRHFLQKTFLSTLILNSSALELRAALPTLFEHLNLDDIEPYRIDLSEESVRTMLGSNSLPKVIQIQATSQTPDRNKWLKGEGKKGEDLYFETALNRHNKRETTFYGFEGACTPVTLLKTKTHDVYGQFFQNRAKNFTFGCVRGFDRHYYIVHPVFRRVFTYQHSCYGLPAADYERVRCDKCDEWHIQQLFQKKCDDKQVTLYAYPNCAKGGLHTFIGRVEHFEPCGVQDDHLSIGAEY